MATQDSLLTAIEATYAAGLDEALWPTALAQVMRTVGGIAATLEVFERRTACLTEFHGHGLPPAKEAAYLDHYATLNPRIPALINGKPGNIVTDYTVVDERSMNRHPFYANLLAPAGYRYCIGGTLSVTAREASLFSVQRTKKQGHVGKDETRRMRLLLPHVRQAFDTTRLLRRTNAASRSFEAALDWLPDGAALTRADGRLLYANQSLQAIARAGDGVRTARGRLEFGTADMRRRYAEALAALNRTRCGEVRIAAAMDFAAMRPSGAPPYLVSIRPLPHTGGRWTESAADAIIFVRDPWQPHNSSITLLREVFGFTLAEASLACALQQGASLADYAQRSALSLNTVYTHFRHMKDKAGCRRMAELIRKLDDLRMPLRLE